MLCEKGRKCGPSDCWQSARCLCRMRRERLIRPTRFCKFNILQEVCRPDKRSASGSFAFVLSLIPPLGGIFLFANFASCTLRSECCNHFRCRFNVWPFQQLNAVRYAGKNTVHHNVTLSVLHTFQRLFNIYKKKNIGRTIS